MSTMCWTYTLPTNMGTDFYNVLYIKDSLQFVQDLITTQRGSFSCIDSLKYTLLHELYAPTLVTVAVNMYK